jgi:hypothetical protein
MAADRSGETSQEAPAGRVPPLAGRPRGAGGRWCSGSAGGRCAAGHRGPAPPGGPLDHARCADGGSGGRGVRPAAAAGSRTRRRSDDQRGGRADQPGVLRCLDRVVWCRVRSDSRSVSPRVTSSSRASRSPWWCAWRRFPSAVIGMTVASNYICIGGRCWPDWRTWRVLVVIGTAGFGDAVLRLSQPEGNASCSSQLPPH